MPRFAAYAETNLLLLPGDVWDAVRDREHPMWEAAGVEFERPGAIKRGSRLYKTCSLGELCLKVESMTFNRRRESGLVVASLENAADYRLTAARQSVSIAPENGGSAVGLEVNLEFKSLLALAALACGNIDERLQSGLDLAAERFGALSVELEDAA